MSDPVSRVLEAIHEAERIARAALDECPADLWVVRPDGYEGILFEYMRVAHSTDPGAISPPAADHVVCNNPESILRRCGSDRLTVKRFEQYRERYRTQGEVGATEQASRSAVYFAVKELFVSVAAVYGISVEEETTGEQT